MDSQLNSTVNLASIPPDRLREFQSSNDDINNSIKGNRISYDFDASDTFSGTNPAVYNYLIEDFNPTESNNTAYSSKNDDEQLAMIKSNDDTLPVIRAHTEKSSKTSVPLSQSVAVSNTKSKQLQLIYPLEDTYRARYKSDYFPQNGAARRPRYIADNAANHFITLQLPTEYQHDLQNMYIRAALLTKSIEGHGHYYSPYKFQKNHNDINIPDENPIYIKVETSREDNFVLRLQLVLIKSKLDQLNYVQPLKLFLDTTTDIRHIIHEEKLTPKELISKYQLDKSQIAFTLCTKLSNGSFKFYPETTIISSVITEVSTLKKPNESVATPSVDSTQNVCCPHCAHRFDPDTPSGSDGNNKRKSTNHKTSRSCSKTTTTEKQSNKKKKNT